MKLDDKTIRNITVSLIATCVCVLGWAVDGWGTSANIALTAICAVVGVGVWRLP